MEVPEARMPVLGEVGATLVAIDEEAILGLVSVERGKPTDEELAVVISVLFGMTRPAPEPTSVQPRGAWSIAYTGESLGNRPFRMATDRRLHAYTLRRRYRDGHPVIAKQAQQLRFPTSS